MVMIPRPYLTIAASKAAAWQQHKERWAACTDCPLHRSRQRTVFTRGQLPCRVLFIGEAPGKSEDVIGVPFVGEAGYLLQEIIEDAQQQYTANGPEHLGVNAAGFTTPKQPLPFRYAITNIVICRPPEDATVDIRPPKREEAAACSRRLNEFIALAEPQMIVLVGVPARKWVERVEGIHYCEIMHPAAMLRIKPAVKQEIQVLRAINTITDTLSALDRAAVDELSPSRNAYRSLPARSLPSQAEPELTGGEIVKLARTLANLHPTRKLSNRRR